jgi:D-alanyl-D-alanine dipeptidase
MNQFFFRIVVPVAVLCSFSCTAWGGSLEKKAAPAPLMEVKTDVPGLIVAMQYATADNFTGKVLYDCNRCFLTETTARKLGKAQMELKKQHLGLKVWDCYRPLSVQKIFWSLVPDPRYVADPAKGSRHNRGTAVDVTLVDAQGNELPMPTRFDDFSSRASRDNMDLPAHILKNRETLENAMKNAGFLPLPTEWWHFDDDEWQSFELLDIGFNDICRD